MNIVHALILLIGVGSMVTLISPIVDGVLRHGRTRRASGSPVFYGRAGWLVKAAAGLLRAFTASGAPRRRLARAFAAFIIGVQGFQPLAAHAAANLIPNPSVESANAAGTLPLSWNTGQAGANAADFTSDCLFNWAEKHYPALFAPSGSPTKVVGVYTYRYYSATNAYLGVSSTDNHVYYMGPDGKLEKEGPLSYWLPLAGCQVFTYKTNGGHTGSKSLYVNMPSNARGDATWYFTPVAVKPNTKYTYSEFYKSNAATKIVIVNTNTSNATSYITAASPGASPTAWTQVKFSFTTPANIKQITIYHIDKVGWLQTDDFSLVEGASRPPTPPTVSITAPAAGSTVTGTQAINVSASDAVGIAGVQFKVDGANFGPEDKAAPYSANWDTARLQNCSPHTVSATARNTGNLTATASVAVTAINRPVVSITSPAPGATVVGSAVPVSASTTGACAVLGVRFKVDGVSIGAEDTSAPYAATLDTTTLTNGPHTLAAVGRQSSWSATATETITVNNTTGGGRLNPIQAENKLPGDSSWDNGSFAYATKHEIEGYASQTSVQAGAATYGTNIINFYVNVTNPTKDPQYALTIYRLGWYGGAGARKMVGPVTLTSIKQTTPHPDPANGNIIAASWASPYSLTVPTTWVSGVYVALLVTKNTSMASYIPFIVRNDGRSSDYIYQSPVATWQAYNCWGGRSLYDCSDRGGNSNPAYKVSYNRPYDSANFGLGYEFDKEIGLIRFLEREGYDVTYQTDIDTHSNDGRLAAHKAMLSPAHNEYWTSEMRYNVEQALAKGVSLGFFGANSVYWQIRLEDKNRTIVGYKEDAQTKDPYALDTNPAHKPLVTTRWRDAPVNRPENALIGVMYHGDPCQGDIVVNDGGSLGQPPQHWIYYGIRNLKNGDKLPGLLGNECDTFFAGAPAGTKVFARSPDPFPDGDSYYSDMSVYTKQCAVGSCVNPVATVFATGTMQWAWGLDGYQASQVVNETAKQMTRNALAAFVGKPPTPGNGAVSPNGYHY